MKQQYTGCRNAVFGLVALLLLILFSSPLMAQLDISAQITGTVTDPSGAAVPAAQLDARNQLTGREVKITSDERGSFIFSALPVGTYTVTCTLTGFQTFVTSGIVLQAGNIVTLPITLKIGDTKQVVEVTAAAAMVNTVTATVQTTFDDRLMEVVPVYGRDARDTLELLIPGAVAAGNAPSYTQPITSFNGMPATVNNYRIDGSDTNDYFHGSPSTYPPVEDISEFSVTTNAADASTARGAGGQIEAVTKTGTNDLHGQVWGYFQNSAWNANSWSNNWQGIPKNHLAKQWWGGNAGGPVFIPELYNGKNKTFFFTSYERTTTSGTSTSVGQTITPAERAGDFSASPDGIPVINGVSTPYIDPASFTTMGKFLAAHTEVLPNPTSGVDTFAWNPSNKDVSQLFLGRIDHNFSEKHRLFGSLWWDRDVPSFNDAYYAFGQASWGSQYPNPAATWGEPNKLQTWTFNDTYTISPNMLNNVIVGINRHTISMTNTYTPSTALFDSADLGIGAVGDVKAPDVQQIWFDRAMGQGLWNGYINPLDQNSWYVSDNFTMTKGRHTLKAGVEIRHYRQVFYQTWDSGATISFSNANINVGGSGNSIADMLLGLTPNFYQNNTQVNNILYPAREAYLQDTFKISKRVTLMYGVRWEPYFGVRSATNTDVTFVPGQASTVFPTAPVGIVTPGDRGIPPNLTGDNWGNIGPRASLAWDIFGNGKAAFRAGYALMSTYQYILNFNSFSNLAPFGVSYSPNPATEDLVHPYAQYGSVPFPWTIPAAGDPNNSSLVFPLPVNTQGTDPHYNNADVHQFNFTFEFEPFNTYLFSVAYVGTRGTHLDEYHDMNFPRFVPGGSTNVFANVMARRPWGPAIQTITMDYSDFNSRYNSLQVRFTKHYSHGLSFLGNYTLSTLAQEQNGPRNLADMASDYYSPGAMQSLAIAFSYALPIPTGKSRLGKAFLGGWTIGGTSTVNSGSYGAVTDSNCAAYNFGSASCNATYTGGGPYSSTKKAPQLYGGTQVGVQWLNPNKFLPADQYLVNGVATTSPNVGQQLFLGNAITGVFKGPSNFMFNASLSKTFAITERLKLNYRIEAVNAFNHTALNMPADLTVQTDMSQFGAITTAMNPRLVQMSGRFIF